MSITTVNNIVSSGTHAARPASPSLATPASGSNPSVIYYETDTGKAYMWDFVGAAWNLISGAAAAALTAPSPSFIDNIDTYDEPFQYPPGVLTPAASGGGTPGGSSGQVQYNNGGAFGGVSNTGQIGQALMQNASGAPSFQTGFLPYGGLVLPPLLSSLTWENQGGATTTQTGGVGTPIYFVCPNDGGGTAAVRGMFKSQPSTPYAITLYFSGQTNWVNSNAFGFAFSDGTKYAGIELLQQAVGPTIVVRKMTSNASYGSTTNVVTGLVAVTGPVIFTLSNDGTTMKYEYSTDGYNIVSGVSEALGTFLTPSQIGFYALSAGASSSTVRVSIMGFG